MLSLITRRSDVKFERSRMEISLAKLAVDLVYRRVGLAALGSELAGALVTVGRAIDARMFARAAEALAGWLILGGVLVVPVAAIGAIIGALLPSGAVVHRHAGDFFAFATAWFVVALLAAQFQRRRRDQPAAE